MDADPSNPATRKSTLVARLLVSRVAIVPSLAVAPAPSLPPARVSVCWIGVSALAESVVAWITLEALESGLLALIAWKIWPLVAREYMPALICCLSTGEPLLTSLTMMLCTGVTPAPPLMVVEAATISGHAPVALVPAKRTWNW